MEAKKLTPKQYLKLHPQKYVMVTYELFKDGKIPTYISEPTAGEGLFAVGTTFDKSKAIIWSSLDNTDTKLQWHKAKTGLKELKFELIQG